MEDDSLQKELEYQFEWFHRNPELSYEEYETTKRIKTLLQEHDIEVLDLPLKTGLVAVIRGGYPGKVIALRSDIVALLLNENAAQLHGTVKLLFQPAEESSLGALKIIETGVLDDVNAIFGIHSTSQFEVGTIGIKAGTVSAAVDRFKINLKGFGSHAAHPQMAKDPIVAAAALVNSLQTIVSRNMDPFNSSVLSITHLQAGNTWNVIPEQALIEGTVRTLTSEERELFGKRLKEITYGISQAYDLDTEIEWIAGPPATVNDEEWSNFAKAIAQAEKIAIGIPEATLGGEDFAFYLEKIRGTFIKIGTGKTYPNHHPKFKVNPAALSLAAKYLSQLAKQALLKLEADEND